MLANFPVIKSQYKLLSDWEFGLHTEYRNESILRAFELVVGSIWHYGRNNTPHRVTLPAGTVLQVDRIYIRKGAEDFDSITFYIVDSPNERLLSWGKGGLSPKYAVRFWAKMTDINGVMDMEPVFDYPVNRNPANKYLHII
jgi:hypothetical protein